MLPFIFAQRLVIVHAAAHLDSGDNFAREIDIHRIPCILNGFHTSIAPASIRETTMTMSTDDPQPNHWLNLCARNVHSQFGEDGIIAQILDLLPEKDHWCVEFGAWDGIHLSNTHHLLAAGGYSGVLIEGDETRFQKLLQNFQGVDRVICLNRLVGFDPENCLDRILESTPIPLNFDLLSIDIDGNDYHVWHAVQRYRPKIVVIEFNPTIPDQVLFVQDRKMGVMHGNSLAAQCHLAKSKGYELVATTFVNALFVDAQYFPLCRIRDNSIAQLHQDLSAVTFLFHGYDGQMFLAGSSQLLWHNLPLQQEWFQLLPQHLRQYPDNYSAEQKADFMAFRQLYLSYLQRYPQEMKALRAMR